MNIWPVDLRFKRVTADGALGPFARSKRDEVLGRQDPPELIIDTYPLLRYNFSSFPKSLT